MCACWATLVGTTNRRPLAFFWKFAQRTAAEQHWHDTLLWLSSAEFVLHPFAYQPSIVLFFVAVIMSTTKPSPTKHHLPEHVLASECPSRRGSSGASGSLSDLLAERPSFTDMRSSRRSQVQIIEELKVRESRTSAFVRPTIRHYDGRRSSPWLGILGGRGTTVL